MRTLDNDGRLLALAAVALLALLCQSASAKEPVHWKTGVAFRQQLNEPIDIVWEGNSLRDGLARLRQMYGIAIWLDRRINPEQELTLTVRDQPLETLLGQIAVRSHAGLALVGPVVYLGPPTTSGQVATLVALRHQEADKLSADAKRRLLHAEPWHWDELAQPRQLLDELAHQAGVSVANADAIPLDLWPAADWPALAWVDRLSLLAAGFGLTYEIDPAGNAVCLVPQPASAVLEKTYSPRGSAADLARQLARIVPAASIRVEEGKLMVTGSAEDHGKIDRLLSGQSIGTAKGAPTANSSSTKAPAEKLYSLTVVQEPAGKVVRTVADSLGKKLTYDQTVGTKLRTPVNLDLKNVTLEYLLEMTLDPLGLGYRLGADALEIVPSRK